MNDVELLTHACKGNTEAVKLCLDFAKITDVWDNLIDGDKPVTTDEIDAAFLRLLIELPANEFFVANRARLLPVMVSSITNWKIANSYEATGRVDLLEIAHNMRFSLADVMLTVVSICGGFAWACEIGVELRTRVQKERLLPYLQEHTKQLPAEWATFRAGFARCLKHTGGTHAIEDLERGLLNGSFQFWTDGKVAALTEFVVYPQCKVLSLGFVAGRLTDSAGELYERIEAYAKQHGCKQVRGGGRRGWLRVRLESKGYRELGAVVAKEL